MINLLGPVLAIAATAVLLLLREFILSIGKNRNSYGSQSPRPGVPGLDTQREQTLRPNPIREFEEPSPQATSIAVDEFLAELRAKAEEQSPSSGTTSESATDLGRAQSNRKGMAGDLW